LRWRQTPSADLANSRARRRALPGCCSRERQRHRSIRCCHHRGKAADGTRHRQRDSKADEAWGHRRRHWHCCRASPGEIQECALEPRSEPAPTGVGSLQEASLVPLRHQGEPQGAAMAGQLRQASFEGFEPRAVSLSRAYSDRIRISARRFWVRPSGVALDAMGRVSPYPTVVMRWASAAPCLTR
jgi:hypothetical protein